jgi:predicted PurR-regulated permease PerM
MHRDPTISDGSGWTRSRIVFLSISAAVVVGTLFWSREALLPFVMALILAYVLTPLVAFAERYKVPRALAIVLVYAITLGGMYLSVAAVAPRLYDETLKLAKDVPTLTTELTARWAPRVESIARGVEDRVSPPDTTPPPPPEPAFEVIKKPDGSFSVEIRSGVDVIQESPQRWRIAPKQTEAGERFSLAKLTSEGLGQLIAYIKHNAIELIKFGQAIFSRVARGIFLFFLTLMVAAYLIMTRESIVAFFRSLPPARSRPSFDRLMLRIDRGLSGVVRGQLLICLVNGVLSAIGLWFFELKYWPILAILAGVMSIVPIFGSILSSVPIVLIGLTQDFWTAVWVLLWIIGIHQIEANFLNPKIIGVAAKIHPVLVVFALLVGEHFFGIWGALLAVPALSIAQSLFQHFRFQLIPDAGPDSLRPPPTAPIPVKEPPEAPA